MGKIKKKIKVVYLLDGWTKQVFNDWWDFADFLKQANLKGQDVTVHHWEYV